MGGGRVAHLHRSSSQDRGTPWQAPARVQNPLIPDPAAATRGLPRRGKYEPKSLDPDAAQPPGGIPPRLCHSHEGPSGKIDRVSTAWGTEAAGPPALFFSLQWMSPPLCCGEPFCSMHRVPRLYTHRRKKRLSDGAWGRSGGFLQHFSLVRCFFGGKGAAVLGKTVRRKLKGKRHMVGRRLFRGK